MKFFLRISVIVLVIAFSIQVFAENVSSDSVLNTGNGPVSSGVVPSASGNGSVSGGVVGGGSTPSGNGSVSGGLVQPASGNGSVSGGVVNGSGSSRLSIAGLVSWFLGLLNYAVQIIIALSLIAFLYGIFRLVFLDASNTTEREKARKFMMWGICALFVMVSVWGLVNVLKTSVFGGGGLIIPTFR